VADHPLRPATDRRLGRPLPHQLANRTSAAPIAQGRYRSPALLLPDHAVLAHLSMGYPPQLDTFRCVTHPFATRHQGCPRAAVRLACVRHAASVQSEPGSNSSVQSIKLAVLPRSQTRLKLQPSSKPQTLCEHFDSFRPKQPLSPNPESLPGSDPAPPRAPTKVPTPIGCEFLKSGGCGGRI
jgi:hypothetical protein